VEAIGESAVIEERVAWRDERRRREIAATLYAPPEPRPPVVVISAGLGVTPAQYAWLAHGWAAAGYLCAFVEHPGTGADVLRAQGDAPLLRAALDPTHRAERARDLSLALDRLGARGDLERAGTAGHSFGAWTALALAGQLDQGRTLRDPRVRAAIGISPQARGTLGLGPGAWAAIDVPCMTLAGSRDTSAGCRDAASRRDAFAHMRPGAKYHVTIDGADHVAFVDDRAPGRDRAADKRARACVVRATVAFLDAHLRDDPAARAWLARDGLLRASEGCCTIERK
jgi:predicted dienelactone hydrolase